MKTVVYVFLGVFSVVASHAVDLPTSVQTPEEVRHCVKASTKDCIRASCITGASQNCRAQCRQIALEKCCALTKQIQTAR